MGTRGIYKFIDQHSTYYVYKHWDNYPNGFLDEFTAQYNEDMNG